MGKSCKDVLLDNYHHENIIITIMSTVVVLFIYNVEMRKIYVFSYEKCDENVCIGIVANTKKEALTKFDYEDIGYEWNNPMKDLDCKIYNDIDVNDIEVWIIDQKRWVRNNIYWTVEWKCDLCDERTTYLYELWWKAVCNDCW